MKPIVFCVRNNVPIQDRTFEFLLQFIEKQKQARILQQRIKQNADNMLIGEILAKVAIKKIFGIDILKQKFAYSEHGKPYLFNYPNVHFNISHSGMYVVCTVADKPVGVDIQMIGEYNPDVAKRVCNEKEIEQIENSIDKASEFTNFWTQKESALKMYGTGISSSEIKNLDIMNVSSQKVNNYWLSVCATP